MPLPFQRNVLLLRQRPQRLHPPLGHAKSAKLSLQLDLDHLTLLVKRQGQRRQDNNKLIRKRNPPGRSLNLRPSMIAKMIILPYYCSRQPS